MYLMYVDESGDPGMVNSPTRYFVLPGLVVHELSWLATLDSLIDFRRRMRDTFGLKLREEIHAAHFIRGSDELSRIPKHDRLAILRHFADELATLPGVTVINVVVDKHGKAPTYDPFEKSWQALIQRFENTIGYRNFRGPANADDRGMIFPDGEPLKKLDQLLRKMRRHNPGLLRTQPSPSIVPQVASGVSIGAFLTPGGCELHAVAEVKASKKTNCFIGT